MTSSVVDHALSVARSTTAAEAALQLGVHGDLQVIKEEFELIQAHLTRTDEERSQDPTTRVQALQLRDVAYDVEDCIEDFRVHLGNWSWWWWCSPSKILKRRRAAAEMEELRGRVDRASKRRRDYSPKANTPASDSSLMLPAAPDMGIIKKSSGANLSMLLTRPHSSHMVVSMCATTATNKTLIGKAYDELSMTGLFRLRAWVKVQQPFNLIEFIRSLLRQFHANSDGEESIVKTDTTQTTVQVLESIETLCVRQLIRSLIQNITEKRYMLVLEDISSREEWDSIKLYLRLDAMKASRIIVTSRGEDVAKYCTGGLTSSSLSLSYDTAVLPAFCNMDLVADVPPEYSSSASIPENIASNSREVVALASNTMPSAEQIRDRIIKTMAKDEETPPELVGREKEMGWLISRMMDVDIEHNKVISICGMRGIGKTALVRNAYCHRSVIDYFTHRIWVTMSYPLDMDNLLRHVLQHLLSVNPTSYVRMPLPDMRMELVKLYEAKKGHLRCLLVVDGLSTASAWDLVKSSLYLEEYKAELRIIVTTRELQVAEYCSRNDEFVCTLGPLYHDDASKLLHLKVFRRAEINVNLGHDMVVQEKKILNRCGGIPFVIVNVGRHLTSRPLTAKEWESTNKNFKLYQLQGNPELESVRTTLESCYSSLPYHVKYCFMYLSIFQEDVSIMRRRLVKRWITEGYMKGKQGPEAEELGERVFNEFLSMTIIQPTKYAVITSGRVRSCSVHPLMLQLSTSKAKEEKLVCMLDTCDNDMASKDTIRHVVIRSGWSRDQEEEYRSMNLSRVRSLTVFGEWRSFFLLREMRMLRVIDLEGVKDLKGCDLKHIGEFRHLKYLGLRSTGIGYLPESVGMLQGLETLDIRYTNVRKLPSTIVHLKSLRVLRGGLRSLQGDRARTDLEKDDPWSVDVPKGIGELRKLITLGTVSIRNENRLVVQELRKLTQLQRLNVTGITDENGSELCSALQHLSSLQSLAMHSPASASRPGLFESLPITESSKYPLEHLQVLKLYGLLNGLPRWILGSRNLFKVYLQNTRLKGPCGSMNVLADLPNLTTLLLLENSIMARELTFECDGFRELELLEIERLAALRYLSFRAGPMPRLKILQVCDCINLEELSFGPAAMSKLDTLKIKGCRDLRLLSFGGAGIKMPMLKNFQVGVCQNLQLLAFQAGDMPNLETLILRHSGRLSVIFEEGAVCKLKKLSIYGCRNLEWSPVGVTGNEGNPSLASSSSRDGMMPNLETLKIEGCRELQGLLFEFRAMPKLESLLIKDCHNLGKVVFRPGALAKLDIIEISCCPQLDESAVSGLQNLNARSKNVFFDAPGNSTAEETNSENGN